MERLKGFYPNGVISRGLTFGYTKSELDIPCSVTLGAFIGVH